MREVDIRKTQYSVSDLLAWLRQDALDLNPPFQRRSVWKPDAKSFFLDTVVKGLPAPIIYLRQQVDLRTQASVRAVVDGQQRLRTLFAYIDPSSLSDYNPSRDAFTLKPVHNKELANKPFAKLPPRHQQRILSYEFSTHVLPLNVDDRDVLEMFARLNATGVKLNHQELRNAEYFGEAKTVLYSLALEQLERWRSWRIFSDDQISRMREVELTSDLVMNCVKGLTGRTQKRLDEFYRENDGVFPHSKEIERRFRQVMDDIDQLLGRKIATSVYHSDVYFFSLFVFLYNVAYGLGKGFRRKRRTGYPRRLKQCLLAVGERFEKQTVPAKVLDAVQRASSDLGRRKTRLEFMKQECRG